MNIDDYTDDVAFTEEPKVDQSALVIRENITRVEGALAEFDRISAGLAELHKMYPADLVYDVTTTKGMAEAIAHRAAWRDPRITVEKFRKTAKAPVLALGKDIDARAAWLTEQLLVGEEPIDQLIKAEEQRKRDEKLAREMKETQRVMAIQEALGELAMEGMAGGLHSTKIAERLEALQVRVLDPLVFQEMMPQAQAARTAALDKLAQALKAAQWDEEQAAKLLAEAAALKLKQEQEDAERARVAEAQRIEAARLAKLAAEQAAAQKAEADQLAAERAAFERQRAEFAAQQEAARKAAEPPAPVAAPTPEPEPVCEPVVSIPAAAEAPPADAAILLAALNCPHTITDKQVVLKFDPSKPGHNALNQLSMRLVAAIES